ncbi:hypothetical protein BRY73_24740 [Ochrobactrum sp. P6BS-III]|nr:hypothetical protein BRY73_24740 [Ochrobactrum sp. P6BS-III]
MIDILLSVTRITACCLYMPIFALTYPNVLPSGWNGKGRNARFIRRTNSTFLAIDIAKTFATANTLQPRFGITGMNQA